MRGIPYKDSLYNQSDGNCTKGEGGGGGGGVIYVSGVVAPKWTMA